MSIQSFLTHRISISRATASRDAVGGTAQTWATVAANVPACLQPRGDSEMESRGRMAGDRSYRVYVLPRFAGAALSILQADRLLYGTRTFEVKGVRNIDELDRFITLDCEEVS